MTGFQPMQNESDISEVFIGLDCSTTAVKAIAWTADGCAVSEGRAPLAIDTLEPGFAQQDAEEWWTSSKSALRHCVESLGHSSVGGIGIACQRETFVLLDRAGIPTMPAVLWYDTRALEEMMRLEEEGVSDGYPGLTGKQFDITGALPKLAWVRKHTPGVFAKSAYFADVLAFLSLRMTGSLRTTFSGVDTTGLVGLKDRKWISRYLAAMGLSTNQMPELVPSGGLLGNLDSSVAEEIGLAPGVPVIAGGGDGHCFALAAAAGRPGSVTLTLGTSAVLGIPWKRPLLGDNFRTLISCRSDEYVLESVIQCGSATVSWNDSRFHAGCRKSSFAENDCACAGLPAGCEGLLVLPYWRGVRVPYNDAMARGVSVGWCERHTAAHFRRAIMEGIAFEISGLLTSASEECGGDWKQLILGGGGATSDLWCRILTDVTGMRCVRPKVVELTSLGAAACAIAGASSAMDFGAILDRICPDADTFEPDPVNVQTYARLAATYRKIYFRNREICHELAGFTQEI